MKSGLRKRQTMNDIIEELRQCFPKTAIGSEFFNQLNQTLGRQHGFTPSNTRFAEGACCDEINEPELLLLEKHWGERFKFGGLAGYCHGGRTGLGAVSHHVPEEGGQKNLLLVAGPHIGWHDGEWGKVPRVGQAGITTSCGALMAIMGEGHDSLEAKALDPLDAQQFNVERIMLPFLKVADKAGDVPLIALATQFLMERVDTDLWTIINGLLPHFEGQIARVTGVTINTAKGIFFCPSKQIIHNYRKTGETLALA